MLHCSSYFFLLNIKYCIHNMLPSLQNCFSSKFSCDVASTLKPLESRFLSVEIALLSLRNRWLIMAFSFHSFESFLLHIIWYLFLWICIWFTFHSHCQDQIFTALLQISQIMWALFIHKVLFKTYWSVVKLLVRHIVVAELPD